MKIFECDRCGKTYDEIDKAKWEKDRQFRIYDHSQMSNPAGWLDLCDECYESFREWTRNIREDEG